MGVRCPDELGLLIGWGCARLEVMGCRGSTEPGPGPAEEPIPDIERVWMWGCGCEDWGTGTATGTATGPGPGPGPPPGPPPGAPWCAIVLPGSRGGEMGSLLMRSGSGEWLGGGVLLDTATCGTLQCEWWCDQPSEPRLWPRPWPRPMSAPTLKSCALNDDMAVE